MRRRELTVVGRDLVAIDVIRLTLADPDGRQLEAWAPGAHLDLELDGITRQYSLCGSPEELTTYQVAVLLARPSRGGSARVHQRLVQGAAVWVSGPRNNFPLAAAPRYLFVAGGIGITPIMPMLRAADQGGADWRLVYGGRTAGHMAFAAELVNSYPERVRVVPKDLHGRIDLLSEVEARGEEALIYACGPEPMLVDCEQVTSRAGCRAALRLERFAAGPDAPVAGDRAFEVELASTGRILPVPVGRSVLDVLLDAGVDLDYSCREGTCGTCETIVLAGTPDHRDVVLGPEEREAGDTMFVCVSRSLTPKLVLDL